MVVLTRAARRVFLDEQRLNFSIGLKNGRLDLNTPGMGDTKDDLVVDLGKHRGRVVVEHSIMIAHELAAAEGLTDVSLSRSLREEVLAVDAVNHSVLFGGTTAHHCTTAVVSQWAKERATPNVASTKPGD